MKHIKLLARHDEETGDIGFVVEGLYGAGSANRDGVQFAHDILEHQNGIRAIGSMWDELEAIGAIWHVRGRWGDMCSDYGSSENAYHHLGAELSFRFQEWEEDEWIPIKNRVAFTRPCDDEKDIVACLEQGRKMILADKDSYMLGSNMDTFLAHMDRYMKLAHERMRIGLRKAIRRHGPGPAAYDQFVAIRDAVREAVPSLDYPGQRFTLSYGDGQAYIRESLS